MNKPLGARDPVWAEPDDPPSAPVEQTTWAELTKDSTAPSRHMIPPDAVVQIIDLRAA